MTKALPPHFLFIPETLTDVESFKDNPIAVIYQSGYLTIKEYDEEFNMPIKDSESVY